MRASRTTSRDTSRTGADPTSLSSLAPSYQRSKKERELSAAEAAAILGCSVSTVDR